MKKLSYLLFIVIFYLSACGLAQDNPELIIDPNQSFVEGEWKLVKSIGSMINIVLEGEDLTREEIYIFTNKGTFTKSTKEEQYEATNTGTYDFEQISDDLKDRFIGVVILKFTEGNGYPNNCFSGDEQKEFLHISKEGELINISSAPCDGPYLIYEKLED